MENKNIHTIKFGDSQLKIEVGKFAELADASVTVSWGETVVLATVVVAEELREAVDFLPLLIDYEERLYAAGKISGSRFIKREGRPSDEATLSARLIDRPLRPLFPKNFRNDVQVVITILSFDGAHDPAVISIIAASTALMLSRTPFKGPVGASRIGLIDGKMIVNPTDDQLKESDFDLVVATTDDKIIMIEAGAREVSEDLINNGLKLAFDAIQPVINLQKKLASDVVNIEVEEDEQEKIISEINDFVGSELKKVLQLKEQDEQKQKLVSFETQVLSNFEGNYKQIEIKAALDKYIQKQVRERILKEGIRPDGRSLDEIRPLSAEVGLLPRTHGSGLFSRGKTQSLTIVTLGAPGDEQFIDTMEQEGTKRYMHHYNFPPFSTGEVAPLRGASRREIGHGALAERALLPMIPSQDDFPYTIRVVSEILSSNGSSSMAATCGSTLALMDAGVPIVRPVAGIAIGLVAKEDFDEKKSADVKEDDYKILTDIQGVEDFGGDMDFKVAGTEKGITAIQMDTKLYGITFDICNKALKLAAEARKKVLKVMLDAISAPRKEMSKYAPRIEKIKINPKKIGDVIGPGGKIIRGIIEDCGGKEMISIDVEESGLILISSVSPEMSDKAKKIISQLTYEVEEGQVFEDAEVVEIVKDRRFGKEVGALVQVAPGKIGMVHISEIAPQRIDSVSSALKIGQRVKVKVIKIDEEQGRIGLSIKRAV
ncbi:MAG: polyribonucleotide nucleotidyltransferase [Candidatus Berkelbacteria bacterium Licking1014_7]|uniref:Polyribonucleotide nucleotidyltransferase n=1 Tax=Candidatus Berkelbacteria bacterium Licking1014_7 TaxID=2017147 RepID=A0A554LI58_9BACT|nr:MAG: polyribonucleotide nucleotidyltransferase [Candidatus Berkelbacteria bacterium Licking1014_7]